MQLIQNNQRRRLRDQDFVSHDHDKSQNIKLVVICSPMTSHSQLIALTGRPPEIFETLLRPLKRFQKTMKPTLLITTVMTMIRASMTTDFMKEILVARGLHFVAVPCSDEQAFRLRESECSGGKESVEWQDLARVDEDRKVLDDLPTLVFAARKRRTEGRAA